MGNAQQDEAAAVRSAAGQALAHARWGTSVLDRAVSTVVARADEISPEHLAALRQVTGEVPPDVP